MSFEEILEKCLAEGKKVKHALAPSKISSYIKCPTQLYLDYHGPLEEKKETHEFLLKKIEEGLLHEDEVCSQWDFKPILIDSLEDGFEKTLKAFFDGLHILRHPILLFLEEELMGIPDLVKRIDGEESFFGDYFYVPVDIKSAIHVNDYHIMQVTFYAYLLGKIQGKLPEHAYLIMGDHRREEVRVSDNLDQLFAILRDMQKVISGKEKPPTIGSHCYMCPWQDHCFTVARERNDISLVSGIGQSKRKLLAKADIKTLKELAEMEIDDVARAKGLGRKSLERWKQQAKAWLKNEVILKKKPELPETKTEVFVDFESADTSQVIWLFGALVRKNNEETMHRFVAYKPEEEGKAFREFFDFLKTQENFRIYHYSSYEKTVLKKLLEKYRIEEELKKKIFRNMTDLHRVVKSSVVLPLHSYSLKPVAKYLGFKWRETKADATKSMYWYDLYLQTGEERLLNLAIEYNEDDCKATKIVKDFLSKL